LGETQVYGLGIPDEQLLSHVLEGQLRRRNSVHHYRVINLGVRAYKLSQQLTLLENTGLTLQPDLVVILVYYYALPKIDTQNYYQRVSNRDWYMLDLNGKPEGSVLLKWHATQLARKSAFVAWLHSLYKTWDTGSTLRAKLLRGTNDNETQEQLRDVEQQLDRFKALSAEHSFRIALAVIPFVEQLSRDYPNERYQSTFQYIADVRDIPFVDLLLPLRRLYLEKSRLPVAPFDNHYDAAAHEAIALQLASEPFLRC
jgi:hypothetical protein